VCLGAQLLAYARGGTVEQGRLGPELGVCRVHLTGAADTDPLLAGLPPILDVVQWHWDEVLTLPPGAVHLAASPAYPHQAFRVGPYAWGLQFHPECDLPLYESWHGNFPDACSQVGLDPAAQARPVEEPTGLAGQRADVDVLGHRHVRHDLRLLRDDPDAGPARVGRRRQRQRLAGQAVHHDVRRRPPHDRRVRATTAAAPTTPSPIVI